jgi:hypothetical protein
VTPVQATRRRLQRLAVMGRTNPFPLKKSKLLVPFLLEPLVLTAVRLSREEREAAYNRARERIFGKDEKPGDTTPGNWPRQIYLAVLFLQFSDTEDGVEMSRSSSVSTKDKSGQGKRTKPTKQRRDDSESFDVRSQYTPFFPQPQMPAWTPTPQYPPMPPQPFNGMVQGPYQGSFPAQYPAPTQQFNSTPMGGANMQIYNAIPQVISRDLSQTGTPTNMTQQYQQHQSRFQPHSAPITAYGSPIPSPPAIPQQWQQQQQPMYQNAFQPQPPLAGRASNTIPYAFGQLPPTANPADPKSQHPIPGSFNRHAFNPKTQSFVPGNTGLPMPQPVSHNGSPHHGSPHHGSPHLSYNAYTPPQQSFGNTMGYGMARQGSNNSLPSYHASPHMPHRSMMHQSMQQQQQQQQGMPQALPHIPHGMIQGIPQPLPLVLPQGMQGLSQNGHAGHHLPNYGNSSTLPPKPPMGV